MHYNSGNRGVSDSAFPFATASVKYLSISCYPPPNKLDLRVQEMFVIHRLHILLVPVRQNLLVIMDHLMLQPLQLMLTGN